MRARLAALSLILASCTPAPTAPSPSRGETIHEARADRPRTRRGATTDRLHGVDVEDPYRWLEEGTPEVKAWSEQQDAYARGWLHSQDDRARLRAALEPLLRVEVRSAPVHRGARTFFSRRMANEDKARFYVRDSRSEPRVLIDPTEFSDDGSVTVRAVRPSPQGHFVSYLVASNASDDAVLRVRDVDTGRDLDLEIDGARYAQPAWLPDESAFFYVGISLDVAPPLRPGTAVVRRHDMGTDPRDDTAIYGPTGDAQMFLHVDVSDDARWLLLTRLRDFSATDVLVADPRDSSPSFVSLTTGGPDRTYVEAVGDRLIAHTNRDAPRFRVMEIDPMNPRAPWRELVGQSDATLESVHAVGDHLVLHYLERAHSRIELRALDGSEPRTLSLPGMGTVGAIVGNRSRDEAYVYFSSFVDPPRWLRIVPSTGETSVHWQQRTPLSTERFEVDQVWVSSRDGTPVSMFVVKRDDTPLDGERPTLLTGYGGFGVSMTPAFSPTAALWVEHGGVFALPNLRGGGEYGEAWHEAGRGANKQNVFDDFIASAQWLIDHGWTQPRRLAIRGGSNGGLLVGAAMTQRPALFGAVVCEVPLLDMVRYHLFGAGPTWIGEYGSADDADQFATLFAYSPYHHIRRGASYPPLLMNSADSDDRVDPNHARKFVAAMQWAVPEHQPALLRIEANAGHGGADSVQRRIDSTVDTLSFLRATVGRP